jgi:DNA polymerase/3'-5' exonuclease PolX
MKFGELILLFNEEIEKIKKEKGPTTRFILTAYNAVFKQLRESVPHNEVATAAKINMLAITPHMKEKLINMAKRPLSAEFKKRYAREALRLELIGYLGIGEKKAATLIDAGLTTIAQLKQPRWNAELGLDTQLMLQYMPERQISHSAIAAIEHQLTNFNGAQIVGSYRRKKPILKDIDIMISSDNNLILDSYLEYLNRIFDKRIHIYSKGADRISFFLQPKIRGPVYKADVFRASPETKTAMLLYSTGPKEFNINMRRRAKKMGYLLNQNGIFNASTKQRIDAPSDDEQRLFEILDMEYVSPDKRV